MKPRRRQPASRLFALACLLLAGSMQAQAVFACSMTETVLHGECCCGDPGVCLQSSCGDAQAAGGQGCCERSVELVLDPQAQQAGALVRPVGIHSAVDPPRLAHAPLPDPVPVPRRAARAALAGLPPPTAHDPPVYLLTQRLRR